MPRFLTSLFGLLLLASHAALADTYIPETLREWEKWVVEKHPEIRCPFLHDSARRNCVWPTQLILQVSDAGASFEQSVDVFSPAWISLPGNDNYWPDKVMANGNSIPVRRLDGLAQVHLPIGQHKISGQLHWPQMPRTLTVPAETGLLKLFLNQKLIAAPNLENNTQLWLTQGAEVSKVDTQDAVTVRVFRYLSDTVPLQITTRLQLDVSGKDRELQLGQMLLDGMTPLAFSSALPARLEADGSVKVQVKAGSWRLELSARSNQKMNDLGYRVTHPLWPQQEIWVFAAEPQLRTVQPGGVSSIDPQQTQLPPEWQHLPAYLLTPDTRLILAELHRGDSNPAANQLSLSKELWLDFQGSAYTVRDRIEGNLNQGWRLEATAPYQLGSASLNGDPQLVTRLTPESDSGVEVRERNINFSALSRVDRQGDLPVSGWDQDFSQVNATLHLAPGWSLLSATGADRVDGSWIDQWSLWDIFLVLIITVTLARTTHLSIGALALATLILTYHRSGAPLFIWLNLAAVLVLLPLVKGKFHRWLRIYATLGFVTLILMLLPYSVDQARQTFYPQQEHPERNLGQSQHAGEAFYDLSSPVQEAAAVEEVVVRGELERRSLSKSTPKLYAPAPQKQSLAQQYDPGQQVQTGPGVPQWSWHRVDLHWSGPVKADEATHFYLLSPWMNRLGSLLSLLLPIALAVLLLQRLMLTLGTPPSYFKQRMAGSPASTSSILPGLLVTAVLTASMWLAPASPTKAEVLIDKELLQELETRLTQPPKCLPGCASIEAVDLVVEGDNLQINMILHSAGLIALPLPASYQEWWPLEVLANDRSAPLLHDQDGRLLINLTQGRHRVTLKGSMHKRDQLTLDFGLPLHNLTSSASEWQVNGAPQVNQPSDSLQLQRLQQSTSETARESLLPDVVPAFVTVTRNLQLGLEWSVETRVQRVAPAQGVINLEIPLLDGESPTSGRPDPNGKMPVRLGALEQSFSWTSVLKQESPLTLTAPEQVPWVEIWALDTAPIWHTQTSGIPSIVLAAGQSMPLWQPWPGESMTLAVTRPTGIAGRHVTLDSLALQHELGLRASNSTLTLSVRSNQGGHYDFTLPEGASLSSVNINGSIEPVSHNGSALKIPLRPGEQTIVIAWQNSGVINLKSGTPELNMGMPSSNQSLNLQLPRDRWPLLVGGPAIGPSVLLWGMLAVVLLMAIGLSRSGLTPLKTHQWVLLSLGICTVNLYSLALIALWLIALNQRGRLQQLPSKNAFKWMQVGLIILSVVTLGILLGSIPLGLLSSPDMHIAGNGSSAYDLYWYQDQSEAIVPSAWVISLPMWSYRLTMLLWSLWLATALLDWIRWGWQQLSHQGLWHSAHPDEKKIEPDVS